MVRSRFWMKQQCVWVSMVESIKISNNHWFSAALFPWCVVQVCPHIILSRFSVFYHFSTAPYELEGKMQTCSIFGRWLPVMSALSSVQDTSHGAVKPYDLDGKKPHVSILRLLSSVLSPTTCRQTHEFKHSYMHSSRPLSQSCDHTCWHPHDNALYR